MKRAGLGAAAVALAVAAALGRPGPAEPGPAAKPASDAGPRWWKGNLHTHTLWSDGDDFPEMVADWYKRHGYHFLALTDHNVLAEGDRWADAPDAGPKADALHRYRARFGDAWVERRTSRGKPQVRLKPLAEFRSMLEEAGRFLLVPAEEISAVAAKAPVHVNALNLRDAIPPSGAETVAESVRVNLRAVASQRDRAGRPMLAFVNHPNFKWALRAEDIAAAEELRFFEVFNGHPGVNNAGDGDRPGCERMWDIVLALRLGKYGLPAVGGLATDDSHSYGPVAAPATKSRPGRGWVVVRAEHLTAESVVRGLEAGAFYASTGVALTDVAADAGGLRVRVAAEPGVSYRTEFVATERGVPLEPRPRAGPGGQPVTGDYGPDVGKVVATAEGPDARYRFTGRELYVRAKVTSNRPHPDPIPGGEVEVAWTQPVVPPRPAAGP